MKRVISVLMCFLLCFSFSVTANAKTIPTSVAQPYYENAKIVQTQLFINGATATCQSTLTSNPDVTKIVAE